MKEAPPVTDGASVTSFHQALAGLSTQGTLGDAHRQQQTPREGEQVEREKPSADFPVGD